MSVARSSCADAPILRSARGRRCGAWSNDCVLANLLAMPIVSAWVMPMGILGILTMPFGLDAEFWRQNSGGKWGTGSHG